MAAERARLDKDRVAAEKEAAQCRAKLDNPAFTDKAPADVVAKIRDRLAAAEADLARITAALEALAAMTERRTPTPVELAIDGGAHEWAAMNAALAAGDIDEAGWYRGTCRCWCRRTSPRDNPRAQSGHSGDEDRWEAARRPLLRAVDAPGDLLDVGCANGYLMESVHRWAAEDGTPVEPYGLDLSPDLADLARRRLPHWADRIWTGNALGWVHPRAVVSTTSVPGWSTCRRGGHRIWSPTCWLTVVGRRLIVGVYNEEKARPGPGGRAGGGRLPHRRPAGVAQARRRPGGAPRLLGGRR